LIDIGAYQPGADPLLDEAVGKREQMEALLTQGLTEGCDNEISLKALHRIVNDTEKEEARSS
jgi:flagellum-specific ATP synthase